MVPDRFLCRVIGVEADVLGGQVAGPETDAGCAGGQPEQEMHVTGTFE